MNAWIILVIAGLCEIIWAVLMKYTQGFTKPVVSVVCIVFMALSVYGLAVAQKQLPLGTSYAVWVGIGIVGATLFGIIVYQEPVTFLRISCIMLILGGIVGLKLVG